MRDAPCWLLVTFVDEAEAARLQIQFLNGRLRQVPKDELVEVTQRVLGQIEVL